MAPPDGSTLASQRPSTLAFHDPHSQSPSPSRPRVLPSVARAGAARAAANAADSIKYKYPSTPQLDALKAEAAKEIDAKAKMIQQMVDQVFSFGELGMQEVETSKYLTGILEKNGFKVERGVAGIPTAWVATWGSGKPVISLGSDIDGIPQASQKPGVGYKRSDHHRRAGTRRRPQLAACRSTSPRRSR